MNFFENFFFSISDWWQNDPNARTKSLFIAITTIFVLLLGYIVYYVNFAIPQNDFNYNVSSNKTQVTPKDFENASKLERVSTTLLGSSRAFIYESNRSVTFDNEQKLNINFSPVNNSPVFFPLSINNSKNQLFINEAEKSTIFDYSSKTFKTFDNINSISPIKDTGTYWFLKPNNSTTQLKQTSNLDNINDATIVDVFSPMTKSALVEIRVFNSQLYIFSWSNANRSGNLEIWHLADTQLSQAQSLNDINNFSFGDNAIVYTTSDDKQATFIDFTKAPNIQKTDLKLDSELAKRNLKGIFSPNRCTIDKNNIILCLIKKNAVSYVDYTQSDAIVQFSAKVNDMKVLFDGINLSGKNVFKVDEKYYIIGQQNSLLYRVKS